MGRRRSFGPLVLVAVVMGSLPVACGEPDRPPSLDPGGCRPGQSCGGPGGGGDTPGGGGAGGTGARTTFTLSGNLIAFTTERFVETAAMSSSAALLGQGELETFTATGSYDGTEFTLPGLLDPPSWLLVATATSSVYLPTFHRQTSREFTSIPLVRLFTLEAIAGDLLQVLDSETASLIVKFVDADGDPVDGATASLTGAEGALLAYDGGGAWSQTATGTGSWGLFVALNVAAAGAPGQFALLTYQGGSMTGPLSVQVPLLADAATVRVLEVP